MKLQYQNEISKELNEPQTKLWVYLLNLWIFYINPKTEKKKIRRSVVGHRLLMCLWLHTPSKGQAGRDVWAIRQSDRRETWNSNQRQDRVRAAWEQRWWVGVGGNRWSSWTNARPVRKGTDAPVSIPVFHADTFKWQILIHETKLRKNDLISELWHFKIKKYCH